MAVGTTIGQLCSVNVLDLAVRKPCIEHTPDNRILTRDLLPSKVPTTAVEIAARMIAVPSGRFISAADQCGVACAVSMTRECGTPEETKRSASKRLGKHASKAIHLSLQYMILDNVDTTIENHHINLGYLLKERLMKLRMQRVLLFISHVARLCAACPELEQMIVSEKAHPCRTMAKPHGAALPPLAPALATDLGLALVANRPQRRRLAFLYTHQKREALVHVPLRRVAYKEDAQSSEGGAVADRGEGR